MFVLVFNVLWRKVRHIDLSFLFVLLCDLIRGSDFDTLL